MPVLPDAVRECHGKRAITGKAALFRASARKALGSSSVDLPFQRVSLGTPHRDPASGGPMPPKNVATDTKLQGLVEKVQKGDPGSKEALLDHACERLLRLTRKMLRNYGDLSRWEQTDDVFQNSMLKLHRSLANVEIQSVRHFFNLAAVHVRRELVDLCRRHFGPEGIGRNHHTDQQAPDDRGGSVHNHAEEPEDLADWGEFHQRVDQLPEEEREVVNLLFYEGLQQEEAADVLGISIRTLKRRWQSARLRLNRDLNCDGQ